jgi:hypothetical protein
MPLFGKQIQNNSNIAQPPQPKGSSESSISGHLESTRNNEGWRERSDAGKRIGYFLFRNGRRTIRFYDYASLDYAR